MTFGTVLNVDQHFIAIKGITLDPLCLPVAVGIIIITNIFWNGDPSSLLKAHCYHNIFLLFVTCWNLVTRIQDYYDIFCFNHRLLLFFPVNHRLSPFSSPQATVLHQCSSYIHIIFFL
jgi:hypothetical protein